MTTAAPARTNGTPAYSTYEELIEQLKELVDRERDNVFAQGDLIAEIMNRFRGKALKQVCLETGLSYSDGRQKRWVSDRFPSGHFARDSGLSYGMLRALAGIDRAADHVVEQLIDKIKEGRWTVDRLKMQLERPEFAQWREPEEERGGRKKGQRQPPEPEGPRPTVLNDVGPSLQADPHRRVTCVHCGGVNGEGGNFSPCDPGVITFRVTDMEHGYLCSMACANAYFWWMCQWLACEEAAAADPARDKVSVEPEADPS